MDSEVSIADDVASNGEATVAEPKAGRSLFARVVETHPTSMTRRAIHGSLWTIAGYGGAQVLRLVSNLVLTRWLNPEAYGLMAIVTVWMQGLQMFSDIGIAPAIIQHRHANSPNFYNTAWTMQVIRGFALAAIGCLIAGPLAWIYGEPQLAPAIMVTSLTALIAGFFPTKLFSEGRELRLPRLIFLEIASQVTAMAVMIPLAMAWQSVWPLVIGGVVFTMTKVVLSQIVLPGPSNRFRWDRNSAQELFGFGRWIFVSTVFTFLGMQTDRLMLPLLISLERLGVYSIGLQVVSIVIGVFEQLTNRILMPAMAHWYRSSERHFRQVVLDSRRFILSAAVIAVANLILLAPALFQWLYDSRYHEAGEITQLLGVGIWFTLLQRTSQASLLAAGDSRALAAANAVNCVVTVVAAYIGFMFWELGGFIGGWTLGNLAGVVVVDVALERHGIPLKRQDVVLTAAMLSFVGAGLLLHAALVAYVPLLIRPWIADVLPAANIEFVRENIWRWMVEILPAGLLTAIASAYVLMSHPRSTSLRERIFGSEVATAEDEEMSEVVTAILGNAEGGVFGGGQD